jgi:hypothetical protein
LDFLEGDFFVFDFLEGDFLSSKSFVGFLSNFGEVLEEIIAKQSSKVKSVASLDHLGIL